ncbi:MAG TPA: hypothetical protein VK912_07725 [Longimicrobiales bacterium]|nr:hypothetical protein [Longimicrobiales bacterium]
MKRWSWTLCAVLFAGACTQDSPTEAGSGLLPPDAIRTFEFVLGPERYLQWDTAFGLYSATADADYTLIANDYEGVLNSRVLLRYPIPRTITVLDTLGVLRTDSMPVYFAGDVRVLVDTLASTDPPATLELYRPTEDWDRLTATWQFRVDSAGAQLPWAQPGGSPGTLIGSTTWAQGDTVLIPVDSATIAAWADTAMAVRGAVLGTSTPGTRIRSVLPTLRLRARSTINPDTVVEFTLAPGRTFIYEPQQPDSVGTPRVGGTPAWRTVMRLRERLDTVTVACPGVPNCTLRLGDVSINYGALLLQPVPSPAGFAPELPLNLTLHAVLPSPLLPLTRSPVTGALGGIEASVPVSSFMAPGAPVVELAATEFMRLLFTPGEDDDFTPEYVALLPAGSTRTFGFGTFAEMPSLRIIVTISRELQLP